MLFVDRAKLALAIDAFCAMARTAAVPEGGLIGTDKALADRPLIARLLLGSASALCSTGDHISMCPNDTEWVVSGQLIGATGTRDIPK